MENKLLSMLKNIKNRYLELKYLNKIKNYGKCEVHEEYIICFVDGDKIKRNSNGYVCYDLWLMGFSKFNENVVNKPVRYIFENVEFDKMIYINSYNDLEIVFKNCIFYNQIYINNANSIVFEDNKYCSIYKYKGGEGFGISCRDVRDANKIKFLNDDLTVTSLNIKNRFQSDKSELINLNLSAREIIFDNCDISSVNLFTVKSKRFVLNNTNIKSKESYIGSVNIVSNNCNIYAENGIIVEVDNYDRSFFSDIESRYVVFNEAEYENTGELKKEIDDLKEQRILLLNTFKNIYNKCNNNILDEIMRVSDKMNNESVKKILKK